MKHSTHSQPAVTYGDSQTFSGPAFHCKRCGRSYPYPQDHAKSVQCECGWNYTNVGHGKIEEAFRSRIGYNG